MMHLLVGVLMLVAIMILLLIISVLSAGLHDSSTTLFPGLGVVMGNGLVLIILFILEVAVVIITAYLLRHVRGQGVA